MNEVTLAVLLDGMDLTDAQWAVLEPIFVRVVDRMDAVGHGHIRAKS